MPISDSFQNLVGYCFPCCDPQRDEPDGDEEDRSLQQERRDRANESIPHLHSRTVSWTSFFQPTFQPATPQPEIRQSVQSVQSMQRVVLPEPDVRHSVQSIQSVRSFQSARSVSTIASMGMTPEIMSSPRFAVSVYNSARISTEQPRLIDVQIPSRPRRARANTVPLSPTSIPSPVAGPSSSRGATFAERFDAIAITNNADLVSSRESLISQRRQTVSVCNFSRPTVSLHDDIMSQIEDDWAGRSPIRRLPSLTGSAGDNEGLSPNARDVVAVSPTPSSMSSGSSNSGWTFQPLCARPAPSTATSTPIEVFSPASEAQTPLTPPDRQPLVQVSGNGSPTQENGIRRRKIIQALEEKSILERRLIELEKMIAARRAEADRALANILSEEDDDEPRSIGKLPYNSPEAQRAWPTDDQSNLVIPVYVPRTTEDAGIQIAPCQGPLAHRRPRRRPHLTRLQIDTASAVVPRLVGPARSATEPIQAAHATAPLANHTPVQQRTPATAGGAISSAVSRISSWLFGEETQYVRATPRRPSFGGYAVGRSPRGGRFIQAHHVGITPTSPYMTAAAISAVLRQHGREQNPEDIIARDPAPPYQEVDPNPSPSFQSVISGSSPQSSPTVAPISLNFDSQRPIMTVL